jgi:hypothetical protein
MRALRRQWNSGGGKTRGCGRYYKKRKVKREFFILKKGKKMEEECFMCGHIENRTRTKKIIYFLIKNIWDTIVMFFVFFLALRTAIVSLRG